MTDIDPGAGPGYEPSFPDALGRGADGDNRGPRRRDARDRGDGREQRGARFDGVFDRVPPQDLAAEMATLGGMLMSKEAVTDVIEVLRGPEFYKPAHEMIFDAIVEVYNRSEPADALIVADELSKRGELEVVGGA